MGCFGSKDKLSKEDMDFLKSHTRYDEATIKEWYKGFKVSCCSKICFSNRDNNNIIGKFPRCFFKVERKFDSWRYLLRNILLLVLQQDCPNGRLTPAKFVDMYKMFFPSGNAEEFCDHVFRTFDMDKNGYIDFKVRNRFFYTTTRLFSTRTIEIKALNGISKRITSVILPSRTNE